MIIIIYYHISNVIYIYINSHRALLDIQLISIYHIISILILLCVYYNICVTLVLYYYQL